MPTIDIDKGTISINGVEVEATNIRCEYERAGILKQIREILFPECDYEPEKEEALGSRVLYKLRRDRENLRVLSEELKELVPHADYSGYTDLGKCFLATSYLKRILGDDHK